MRWPGMEVGTIGSMTTFARWRWRTLRRGKAGRGAEQSAGRRGRWTGGGAVLSDLCAGLLEVEIAGDIRYPANQSAVVGRWVADRARA
jgi:hypothetical protein